MGTLANKGLNELFRVTAWVNCKCICLNALKSPKEFWPNLASYY